jgi:hypothetical protein
MLLILVVIAVLLGLTFVLYLSSRQTRVAWWTHESVYMGDESSVSSDCLKSQITPKISLNEGEVIQWDLSYGCSIDRDVAIVFTGSSPCEEHNLRTHMHRDKNPIDSIRCTIKQGAAAGGFPYQKYPYLMRGPKNDTDPELDVPRPKFSVHDLLLAVIGILEVLLGVVWGIQLKRFGRSAVGTPER